MTIKSTLHRRVSAVAAATALVVSSFAPVLLLSGSARAASQVTNRQITMSTSVASATGASYAVSFNPATSNGTGTDDIKGIVVDFCANSPLIGASCTQPTTMVTPNSGTVQVTHAGATGQPINFTASGDGTGKVILTDATGLDLITLLNTISFTLPSITNTATIGTFYARILTFNSTAAATAYTSGTPGTHLDEGGVALSTARQLTVNARVQEQLEFCVGAVPNTVVSNGTAPANCSATEFNGTTQTVDIGVVDSGAPSISPVPATSGGNDKNGAVMIRTNAVNGAVISYFAEQAGTGTNHLGALRVTGATCSAGSSSTDQCFESAGTSQIDFSTAGEKFGMTASAVYRPTGSTTTNLTRNSNYDGDGTAGIATGGFAWDDSGTATALASSSTVLDYEMLLLNFAARAAATTPTGSYSVTSTYIATSTF